MQSIVHIPRDKRSKLDKKTKECIFLGYYEDEFGYNYGIHVIGMLSEEDMLFSLKIRLLKIVRKSRQILSHVSLLIHHHLFFRLWPLRIIREIYTIMFMMPL